MQRDDYGVLTRAVRLAEQPCPTCGGTRFLASGRLLRCTACRAVLTDADVGEMVCRTCGETNPPGGQFCGHCGTPLTTHWVLLGHCPVCGHRQPRELTYCMHCGTHIAGAIANSEAAPTDARCPACDHVLLPEQRYCYHCGAGPAQSPESLPEFPTTKSSEGASPLPNPYRYCPACGFDLTPESDLCRRCGTDASDYIAMIRAISYERVARIVAEEEAALRPAPVPYEKLKGGSVRGSNRRALQILLAVLVSLAVILLLLAVVNILPLAR